MTVTAVVVNFNAGDHLLDCVRSLRAAGVSDILVVDNDSTDGSLGRLAAADPDVSHLETGANLGYGGGVNQGLTAVATDLVLVTNPDVVFEPGAVKALVAAADAEPRIGIVGPRIDEADGTLYPSARTFPSLTDSVGHAFVGLFTTNNPYSRRYLLSEWDHAAARDIDWVSGACFLARKEALVAIGGFDPAYFMYLEDVDLCRRVGAAGWRVRYEPAAVVRHVGGVSTSQTPYRMLAAHHRSLLRYWWRTSSGRERLLAPVVATGLAVRLGVMVSRRALTGMRGK
jgi:N-acetylglucosaminyl-diphospho-decaprenol L-rhamnosyltransferase